MSSFEKSASAPNLAIKGLKKQEKSYKDMMIQQKKAKLAKTKTKPAKVVLLSLLNEKPKKAENSELSDIN